MQGSNIKETSINFGSTWFPHLNGVQEIWCSFVTKSGCSFQHLFGGGPIYLKPTQLFDIVHYYPETKFQAFQLINFSFYMYSEIHNSSWSRTGFGNRILKYCAGFWSIINQEAVLPKYINSDITQATGKRTLRVDILMYNGKNHTTNNMKTHVFQDSITHSIKMAYS